MKIIQSRMFKILVTIFVLGILLGVISYIAFGIKTSSIISYFETIKNEKFNYSYALFNSIKNSYKFLFIIWIFGIVFIFSIFTPFIVCFRGISVGFTISMIIYTYKLKGVILSLIMLFPSIIINELVFILISFYSINFSIKTYKTIKNNKTISLWYFIKNYFYQLIIFMSCLFISSLFEVYITSNIIKYML